LEILMMKSDNPSESSKRGLVAEEAAAGHFRTLGYAPVRVSPRHHGVDLVAVKNGEIFFVEVKSLSETPSGQWVTGRIGEGRVDDDILAVVLPNLKVVVMTMAAALDSNYSRGKRCFTELVRQLAPEYVRPEVLNARRRRRAYEEMVALLHSRGDFV
jgi:hypothetical protein